MLFIRKSPSDKAPRHGLDYMLKSVQLTRFLEGQPPSLLDNQKPRHQVYRATLEQPDFSFELLALRATLRSKKSISSVIHRLIYSFQQLASSKGTSVAARF